MTILNMMALGFIACSLMGCVTVILDNAQVLSPPKSDPLRFEEPVCVKISYSTDDLNALNIKEGRQEMNYLAVRKYEIGLPYYYNISTKCDSPVGEYRIVDSSKTRNYWIRVPWAIASVITLGIIPYYIEEVGDMSIYEGDTEIATFSYREKRLTSIFALGKYFRDDIRTTELYRTEVQAATVARQEAILIRKALGSKNNKPGKSH